MRLLSTMTRALVTSAALVAMAHGTASAQADYPNRPVSVIVPQATGGANDTIARIVTAKLSEILGQQFVVENRPGAGGNIGADLIAKAQPDGYSLVMGAVATHAINPSLYSKIPYDAVRDFAPVALVASVPNVLIVNKEFADKNGIRTMQDLVKYALAHPGKLNYASAGNGTWNHLFAEQLKSIAKIKITHIPYKGSGPAVSDVVAGHVQMMITPFPSARTFLTNGRLRALAVTGTKRSALFPEVPTASEAGLPGYTAASWFGILAPAGTPRPIIDRLNAESVKAMSAPDMRERFAAMGGDIATGTPEQTGEFLRAEYERWGKVIREANIKAE